MTKRLLICFALLALLLTFLSNANSMDTRNNSLDGIEIELQELDLRISTLENRATPKLRTIESVERQLNDLRLRIAKLAGVEATAYHGLNSDIDHQFARLLILNKALRAGN